MRDAVKRGELLPGELSDTEMAEADADGSKGAASEQPELTPKEKLGVWAMNNFKAAEVTEVGWRGVACSPL